MLKEKLDPKRFKTLGSGYIFDKRIFRVCLIVIVFFFAVVIFINGFEPKYYFVCDNFIPCDLTLFKEKFCKPLSEIDKFKMPQFETWVYNSGLCDMDFAPVGFEFGTKPSGLQGSEFLIIILILLLAFGFNHFFHNRDFEFEGDGLN